MPNTPQRTQEQERMQQAWADVQSVKAEKHAKEYKSLVRGAPADIQTSGLGQTLAFWEAKGKGEHLALDKHVSNWLRNKLALQTDLMQWIMQPGTSSANYVRATREALAYLIWLKRFAEAEIEDPDKAPVAQEVSNG